MAIELKGTRGRPGARSRARRRFLHSSDPQKAASGWNTCPSRGGARSGPSGRAPARISMTPLTTSTSRRCAPAASPRIVISPGPHHDLAFRHVLIAAGFDIANLGAVCRAQHHSGGGQAAPDRTDHRKRTIW
jgi:hypothetical protein